MPSRSRVNKPRKLNTKVRNYKVMQFKCVGPASPSDKHFIPATQPQQPITVDDDDDIQVIAETQATPQNFDDLWSDDDYLEDIPEVSPDKTLWFNKQELAELQAVMSFFETDDPPNPNEQGRAELKRLQLAEGLRQVTSGSVTFNLGLRDPDFQPTLSKLLAYRPAQLTALLKQISGFGESLVLTHDALTTFLSDLGDAAMSLNAALVVSVKLVYNQDYELRYSTNVTLQEPSFLPIEAITRDVEFLRELDIEKSVATQHRHGTPVPGHRVVRPSRGMPTLKPGSTAPPSYQMRRPTGPLVPPPPPKPKQPQTAAGGSSEQQQKSSQQKSDASPPPLRTPHKTDAAGSSGQPHKSSHSGSSSTKKKSDVSPPPHRPPHKTDAGGASGQPHKSSHSGSSSTKKKSDVSPPPYRTPHKTDDAGGSSGQPHKTPTKIPVTTSTATPTSKKGSDTSPPKEEEEEDNDDYLLENFKDILKYNPAAAMKIPIRVNSKLNHVAIKRGRVICYGVTGEELFRRAEAPEYYPATSLVRYTRKERGNFQLLIDAVVAQRSPVPTTLDISGPRWTAYSDLVEAEATQLAIDTWAIMSNCPRPECFTIRPYQSVRDSIQEFVSFYQTNDEFNARTHTGGGPLVMAIMAEYYRFYTGEKMPGFKSILGQKQRQLMSSSSDSGGYLMPVKHKYKGKPKEPVPEQPREPKDPPQPNQGESSKLTQQKQQQKQSGSSKGVTGGQPEGPNESDDAGKLLDELLKKKRKVKSAKHSHLIKASRDIFDSPLDDEEEEEQEMRLEKERAEREKTRSRGQVPVHRSKWPLFSGPKLGGSVKKTGFYSTANPRHKSTLKRQRVEIASSSSDENAKKRSTIDAGKRRENMLKLRDETIPAAVRELAHIRGDKLPSVSSLPRIPKKKSGMYAAAKPDYGQKAAVTSATKSSPRMPENKPSSPAAPNEESYWDAVEKLPDTELPGRNIQDQQAADTSAEKSSTRMPHDKPSSSAAPEEESYWQEGGKVPDTELPGTNIEGEQAVVTSAEKSSTRMPHDKPSSSAATNEESYWQEGGKVPDTELPGTNIEGEQAAVTSAVKSSLVSYSQSSGDNDGNDEDRDSNDLKLVIDVDSASDHPEQTQTSEGKWSVMYDIPSGSQDQVWSWVDDRDDHVDSKITWFEPPGSYKLTPKRIRSTLRQIKREEGVAIPHNLSEQFDHLPPPSPEEGGLGDDEEDADDEYIDVIQLTGDGTRDSSDEDDLETTLTADRAFRYVPEEVDIEEEFAALPKRPIFSDITHQIHAASPADDEEFDTETVDYTLQQGNSSSSESDGKAVTVSRPEKDSAVISTQSSKTSSAGGKVAVSETPTGADSATNDPEPLASTSPSIDGGRPPTELEPFLSTTSIASTGDTATCEKEPLPSTSTASNVDCATNDNEPLASTSNSTDGGRPPTEPEPILSTSITGPRPSTSTATDGDRTATDPEPEEIAQVLLSMISGPESSIGRDEEDSKECRVGPEGGEASTSTADPAPDSKEEEDEKEGKEVSRFQFTTVNVRKMAPDLVAAFDPGTDITGSASGFSPSQLPRVTSPRTMAEVRRRDAFTLRGSSINAPVTHAGPITRRAATLRAMRATMKEQKALLDKKSPKKNPKKK